MLSFSQVKSAGSAGNYYTEKDNYYVIGSMEERWQGKGAELLGLEGKVDKQVFTEQKPVAKVVNDNAPQTAKEPDYLDIPAFLRKQADYALIMMILFTVLLYC